MKADNTQAFQCSCGRCQGTATPEDSARMRELDLHGDKIIFITDGKRTVEAARFASGDYQYRDPGFTGPTHEVIP